MSRTLRQLSLPAALALLALAPPARAAEPRVVEIEAKRFEFQPAQITLKAGEPAVLRVHSQDVTHGFYMKSLGIDATIAPGRITEVPVTPRAPGRYSVICDHFCGAGHGNMKMTIVVE